MAVLGLFFFFSLSFGWWLACYFLSFFFSSRFFIAQVGILSLVVVLTFDDICSTVSVQDPNQPHGAHVDGARPVSIL